MAFLAAALGAGAALFTGWLTSRREATAKEQAAVNNLLLDLAAKRAFALDPNADWAPGAGPRILESVNHTRTLIRAARAELSSTSEFLAPLRMMMLACNTFVEQAEYQGNEPTPADLDRLVRELRAEAQVLHHKRPKKIVPDAPGSMAVSRRISR
ncbi:hypothetical protein AB1K56_11835 [Microbacterium sp. BWR-S6Y]|uniref:hypothetical protein n=1 Tax=Microbacterium sp. BWR-S6Y TaxID=3232073 RepID=UPI0035287BA3